MSVYSPRKGILILSDNDELSRAIELNLSDCSDAEIVRVTRRSLGRQERQAIGDPCLIIVATSSPATEPGSCVGIVDEIVDELLLLAAVLDAGFKVKAVQAAGIPRFVLRGAKNLTARRNVLPPYKGRGRQPVYGKLVRPRPRKRKERTIAATPPDRVDTWQADGRTLRAERWDDLVTTDTKVDKDNPVSHVAVIHDPRFKEPWVLITPLKLPGMILWRLYQARWPIEQVPLVAKQTLGGVRHFCLRPRKSSTLAGTDAVGQHDNHLLGRSCLPRRPVSGIASPNPRLGDSVECWPERLCRQPTRCQGDLVKRHR